MGTGKTYALARIFLRLVAEKGVEVSKILTVTFTSAATEELCDRIRSLLVEAYETLSEDPKEDEDPVFLRLREMKDKGVPLKECIRRIKLAITCFDEAIISTIHGFCNRVLAENSFETQSLFDVELTRRRRKWPWRSLRVLAGKVCFRSSGSGGSSINPKGKTRRHGRLLQRIAKDTGV